MADRAVGHRVATIAKAVTLHGRFQQSWDVVLSGNIGKFSLGLRQPLRRLSLQTEHITDDDPDAASAASGRLKSVICWAELRS